uniref:Uncharacterized protein n=1 Tax=Trichogramma kaykai TaxID=54128 RepID=A0ABD2VX50_9HYME
MEREQRVNEHPRTLHMRGALIYYNVLYYIVYYIYVRKRRSFYAIVAQVAATATSVIMPFVNEPADKRYKCIKCILCKMSRRRDIFIRFIIARPRELLCLAEKVFARREKSWRN